MKKNFGFLFLFLSIQVSFAQCDSAYTYYPELPPNVTILIGDSCLYDNDIAVLDSLISINDLEYDSPLVLGTQTWSNGRLKILVAGYYFGGVNEKLEWLPNNMGDLGELTSLYLEWNALTELPESISQLTSLVNLFVSNNDLVGLPESIGDLENLFFLDLGYNEIESIPNSICNLLSLDYLWLFNNQLDQLPECFCDLNLEWSENDPFFLPYFAIGGNYLCENLPECVENSENLNISLDQFYYSFPVYAPQDCDNVNIFSTFLPNSFYLYKNYPNPFNPSTTIRFDLPELQYVNLSVYDLLGEKVDDLLIGWAEPGSHQVVWNAKDIPSGTYYYRLVTPHSRATRKLVLIK